MESKSNKRAAREAASAARKEAANKAAAQARVTKIIVVVAILAVVGIGAGIALLKQQVDSNVAAPKIASKADGYGLVFNPNQKVQIDVWEDFQCPACKNFEDINGATLKSLAKEGKAKVVFHSLSFLGAESKILATGGACAADEGKFLEWHEYMYKNQQPENSGFWGLSKVVLAGIGIGADGTKFKDCMSNSTYSNWVQFIETNGAEKNINQTPTVFINGKELDRNAGTYIDNAKFMQALSAAGIK